MDIWCLKYEKLHREAILYPLLANFILLAFRASFLRKHHCDTLSKIAQIDHLRARTAAESMLKYENGP